MLFLDQAAVANALPYPALMDALASGLQQPIQSPLHSHFEPNNDASSVLIMPAWRPQVRMGVKLVSIWPGNGAVGKPAVSGVYVLLSCTDGQAIAVMDGTELTARRTAATAALGARLLARPNSRTLAVLGTGSLCVPLVQAHCSAQPFQRVLVWGRRLEQAERVVAELSQLGIAAEAQADLQTVLANADVAAAASTATTPFIRRDWVQPGTHLGLIGAFTPAMAEAEPGLMARCQLFADNREAVLQKGGEVLQAIQQGLIQASAIEAELVELVAAPEHAWRLANAAITVFKSVGFAALDLIAAEQVMAQQACGK